MRLSVVVDRPLMTSEGGEWNLVQGRNEALVRRYGLDLRMYCVVPRASPSGGPPEHWLRAGYPIEPVTYSSSAARLLACRGAMRVALGDQPDAVMVSGGFTWLAIPMAQRQGLRVIFDLHGAVRNESQEYGKVGLPGWVVRPYYDLNDWYARDIEAILVVTPELWDHVARIHRRAVPFVVPCASPTQLRPECVLSFRNQWREAFGIPSDAWCLLHSGGIGHWQATDAYFATFPGLLTLVPNAWLLVLTGNVAEAEASRQSMPPTCRCPLHRGTGQSRRTRSSVLRR